MTKAFERRDRASELEKLYISTHYYEIVTGELDKSIEAYQLWKRTYPRDSIPTNNLAIDYAWMGKFDQALAEGSGNDAPGSEQRFQLRQYWVAPTWAWTALRRPKPSAKRK